MARSARAAQADSACLGTVRLEGIALDEVARIDATRREVAEAIDDAIERVRSEN